MARAGQKYVCASHTNGGRYACSSRVRVSRAVVEERLPRPVCDDLLGEAAVTRFVKTVRELRTSTALGARLAWADAELSETERDLVADEVRMKNVVDLMPKAVARYRERVANLRTAVNAEDLSAAQHDVAALLGGEVCDVDDPGEPVAEIRLNEGALVAMCLGTRAPAYMKAW